MPAIGTYVALGDSFTEGVGDPYPDRSLQGWADLAASFEQAVKSLRAAGGQVLIFTGFDPSRIPLLRMVRDKAAAYNERLREIARRHDSLHVDLWSTSVLADSRVWCADRLHLGPEGHRRVALRACEVAGLPVREDWREPLPPKRPDLLPL